MYFSIFNYICLHLFEVLMNLFTTFSFSDHLALEKLENWSLICWLSIMLSHQLIAHLVDALRLVFLGCSFLPCHLCKVLWEYLQLQCTLQTWVIHLLVGIRPHHRMYQCRLLKHKLLHPQLDQVLVLLFPQSATSSQGNWLFICILDRV